MKNDMWFLITDGILEYYAGATSIMNNSIQIGMKYYCEITGFKYETLKKDLEEIIENSLKDINRDLNNQDLFIEFIKLRLMKLKMTLDA